MNKTIGKTIGLQIIVTILITMFLAVIQEFRAAYSAFIGGAIGFIPGLAYGITVYCVTGASPAKVAGVYYVAEFLKIALTLLLFAATFIWLKEISFAALFITYVMTLAVYWIALFFK